MASEPPSFTGPPRRSWQPPERSRRGEAPLDETTSVGDEDALALSGPGAPGKAAEHPVRARLLERSQAHEARQGEASQPGGERRYETTPLVHLGALPVVSHHLDDDSSATLLRTNLSVPTSLAEAPTPPGEPESPANARSEVKPSPPPAAPTPRIERASGSLTPAPPAVTEELARIAGALPPGPGVTVDSGTTRSPYVLLALNTFLGLSGLLLASLFMDRLYEKDTSLPDGEAEVPAAPKVTLPAAPARQKIVGPPRIEAWLNSNRRVLKGRVGKEPFLKALEAAGLPKGEAYRAFAALRGVKDLDHCASSDRFEALVEGPTKKLIALEYLVSPEEVYQANSEGGGPLKGARLDLKVERNQIRRALVMNGSFDDSARMAGFDAGLGNVLEKALSGHITLRELRRGDRLRVVVQEVTVLGEFARYAGVEALEIDRQNGKTERFYYFNQPGETGYFDNLGRAPWEGGFRKPIPGAPVTSKFNMKRMHPVLKKIMPHTGTDFGAPAGTPILATKAGKVTFIGWGGPSGNLVKVAHDGGYESGYAHLSKFPEGVKVGDAVDRLALVGYVGSTGRSTGPHLHFTIKKNGEYIDPESVNLDGKRVLSPSARESFAQVRQKYDAILDAMPWPAALPTGPLEPAPAEFIAGGEQDMEEGAGTASATPPAPTAPAAPAAPQEPALAQVAPPPGAPRALDPARPPQIMPNLALPAPPTAATKGAIFLSDSDLLKMQSATDSGEVP